jgi:hypothetical protein
MEHSKQVEGNMVTSSIHFLLKRLGHSFYIILIWAVILSIYLIVQLKTKTCTHNVVLQSTEARMLVHIFHQHVKNELCKCMMNLKVAQSHIHSHVCFRNIQSRNPSTQQILFILSNRK